jgi:hypothetical protein
MAGEKVLAFQILRKENPSLKEGKSKPEEAKSKPEEGKSKPEEGKSKLFLPRIEPFQMVAPAQAVPGLWQLPSTTSKEHRHRERKRSDPGERRAPYVLLDRHAASRLAMKERPLLRDGGQRSRYNRTRDRSDHGA